MAENTVKVNLKNSYGYMMNGERRYYGPGQGIEVPAGLAQTLGLEVVKEEPEAQPVEAQAEESQPAESQLDLSKSGHWLPDNFPGRDHLLEAGYGTIEEVGQLSKAQLMEIKGIGRATAQNILDYSELS